MASQYPDCDPIGFELDADNLSGVSEDTGVQLSHLIVTNPTRQSIYLPDAPEIVPPRTYGKITPIRASRVVRATWRIPPQFGLAQPTPIGAAIVAGLPAGSGAVAHPGFTLAAPAGDQLLGILDVPLGGIGGSPLKVVRPDGVEWLRLNITGGTLLELDVIGDQTGTSYSGGLVGVPGDELVGVFGVFLTDPRDTTLTISAQASAMQSATVIVSGQAEPDELAPAPWEFPNQAPFVASFFAGAGQLVIAGQAGRRIRIFGGEIVVRAAGAAGSLVQLLNGAGGTPLVRSPAGVINAMPFNRGGAALSFDTSLVVDVPAAVACDVGLALSIF